MILAKPDAGTTSAPVKGSLAMTNLEELHARFQEKLPARAQEIARCVQEEAVGGRRGDGVSLGRAWREAHKLAGTAGSFGYDRVSEAAKRLEGLLESDVKGRRVAIPGAMAELNEAIRDATEPKRRRRDSVPRIGLAGESKVALECAELLTNERIEVVPLGWDTLSSVHSHPDLDVVIVDASEAAASGAMAESDPLTFIRSLRSLPRGMAIAVILLVPDSRLETRIAAAHAGVDLIVAVPLSRAGITEAIRMVNAKQLDRPVVLAIDDDLDALQLVKASLQSRFNVVTLSEPSEVLTALREHQPSALVVDYDMPGVSGLELCASVRLSRENNQIPIVFVTDRNDRQARLSAFAAGCDDYLTKSAVQEELASRVGSRIQRTAGLRAAAEIDSLTGLLLRRAFIPALESRISEATRRHTPLAVCVLDIDRFKNVNDTHGHLVGDRVLADLGALIQQRFRREDLRCRWGGEEFALAFPGETADTIELVLAALLSEFSKMVFQGQSEAFQVTFSAGAACLGSDGVTMEQLMAVADDRLYLAKSTGRARIAVSGRSGDRAAPIGE